MLHSYHKAEEKMRVIYRSEKKQFWGYKSKPHFNSYYQVPDF